ncbi:MAG: LL-diaminopimelate aminotransferase [Bacteroidaceae bacterium]|nr:LL-diaminopimelate aminotransferase [Bacteroidaceae bacterium]
MTQINAQFLKLRKSYLFIDIANRVNAYRAAHPEANIISLGIGDVTQPLAPAVIEAMHKAVSEMGEKATFRGYGPEHGYAFLQDAILENDFLPRGIHLERNDIFINDGAKSDTGNIGDILSQNNSLCLTDPIYPVYVDSNVMGSRAGHYSDGGWSNITYLPCNAANHFSPEPPAGHADIIYLCYPNNPTGAVITRDGLAQWVSYALRHKSIIMYDAAYEAYIQSPDIPHSIYEIEGAKRCAIEFHSYSKTAGFTGLRCGYTVIPQELTMLSDDGAEVSINQLWNRRQSTKYNGTSYISQCAAAATYTPEGKQQVRKTISYYMTNARIMRQGLKACGLNVYGGQDAPYIWVQTPGSMGSWDFFQALLEGPHLVSTPGVGFGPSGEGFIRLTSFASRENTVEAIERISTWL